MLIDYRNFKTTVQMIKPLIIERTKKDNMSALHLGKFTYRIMMKRFLTLKAISLKKSKTNKIVAKNKGSGISTDEEIYVSPIKPKNMAKMPKILPT